MTNPTFLYVWTVCDQTDLTLATDTRPALARGLATGVRQGEKIDAGQWGEAYLRMTEEEQMFMGWLAVTELWVHGPSSELHTRLTFVQQMLVDNVPGHRRSAVPQYVWNSSMTSDMLNDEQAVSYQKAKDVYEDLTDKELCGLAIPWLDFIRPDSIKVIVKNPDGRYAIWQGEK
jgi:hypothetical protein